MPAANKLLEAKGANPKLFTTDLYTMDTEKGKWLLKTNNVKAVLPLQMCWSELLLGFCRLALLQKVLNRAGPVGGKNPIMKNNFWSEIFVSVSD